MNPSPHVASSAYAILSVYVSLIVTCLILTIGFFIGAFLYRPVWGVLMWPEAQALSTLGWDKYEIITEILLGRVPVNRTSMGVFLGVLFWWPLISLIVISLGARYKELSSTVTKKWVTTFFALSFLMLLFLVYVITPRGFPSIVAEGVLLFLLYWVSVAYGNNQT